MLDEDNSRHVIQVLRMKPGERLQLTDGLGHLLEGEIVDAHKKHCQVVVRNAQIIPPPSTDITIAISPLKNASRFEWFLEKATEIGVRGIIPLICERTERQSIRADRLQNILVSAMLQSQQAWLPILPEPQTFHQLIAQHGMLAPDSKTPPGVTASPDSATSRGVSAPADPTTSPDATTSPNVPAQPLRLIAHCLEAPRPTASLADVIRAQAASSAGMILIGPEGDFTPKEVELALASGYKPVSLGQNRLRTETAGVVAATLLCIR